MQIFDVIQAVEAVETHESRQYYLAVVKARPELTLEKALKRIPEHLKDSSPYSVNALWTFYLDTEHQPEGPSCLYCKMFDGQTFTGSQLRRVFPDHKWVGDDIYANVHMTLWGKDGTCGCLLVREDDKWGSPENLSLWSQLGTDWTEKPKTTEESIDE
jgi:hypothetical protein